MTIYDQIGNIFTCIYKYTLPTIFILNNLGNFTSALIFFRKSWKRNVCVLYLKIYLLVDSFYTSTYLVYITVAITFHISPENIDGALCKIYQYTFYLSITLLPNTLFMASIDRLLISSQKIDTRLYSSKRLAYFLLSISTTLWIIYYSHLLIKSDIQQISPNSFLCGIDQSEPYLSFVYYSLAVTNFVGCLLLIILCLLSFKNVRKIQIFPSHQRQGTRSMTKKDFQLLRCLYTLDVIYIVFSMLTSTYDAYAELTKSQRTTELDRSRHQFLAQLFTILAVIPHVSSFWIFVSISKAFRNEIKKSFRKI